MRAVEGVVARIASITDPEGNTITLAQPDEADSDPAIGPRVGEFTHADVPPKGTSRGGHGLIGTHLRPPPAG